MLPNGPTNYTSIGVATILVFLNVILLHEGYKFVDMTIQYMYNDRKQNCYNDACDRLIACN